MTGSKLSVWIVNEVSTSFVTLDGLKQVDALSSILVKIALDGVVRRSGVPNDRFDVNVRRG